MLALLGDRLGPVHSDLAKGPLKLLDAFRSRRHAVNDLGEDADTEGRVHPMIDPDTRNRRILAEAADPDTALLLLDLVMGYGAHDDPASDLARTLEQGFANGRSLPVIVTFCGTRGGPQGYGAQVAALCAAGALVAGSNAEAVCLATRLLDALDVQPA
ncbi:MAG: hypothetical protein CML68_11255 [Rhodobacteraceae bacterium]|nr:hypothetical protein [Paracoccaceae bacterium]